MSISNKPQTINRVLPSTLTAYHEVVHEILTTLEQMGWTKEQCFGVHMALEESISNAVRHGNKHDPHKSVHISCELTDNRFYAEILDEGPGYDPCHVPDCCADENLEVPGGRGLALMRAYMDRVEHRDCGKRVILEKVLH